MNRLSKEIRAKILHCLCEGMSIRSTSRTCDVRAATICDFVLNMGKACQSFHDRTVHGLGTQRVQMDELWQFVGCKARRFEGEMKWDGKRGDAWTFTALDADTKLLISWVCGRRDVENAFTIMHDLRSRVDGRIQLTTDAFTPYYNAVRDAFGDQIDYGVLKKIYTESLTQPSRAHKDSYALLAATKKIRKIGKPDLAHISTSFIERSNLTLRMGCKRFARLSNAHSKNMAHHCAMQAIFFTFYNFARVHSSLRVTPAMEAGLTDHVWTSEEIVNLLAKTEPKAKRVWSLTAARSAQHENAKKRTSPD